MDRMPSSRMLCCALFALCSLLPLSALAENVLVASNAIYVVDTDKGEVRELTKLGRFVKDLAVNGEGTRAYAATSAGILEIDLASGNTVRTFGDVNSRSLQLDEATGNVYGLFTPGAGEAPEIRTFSLASGQQTLASTLPESTIWFRYSSADNAVLGLEHGSRALSRHDASTGASAGRVNLPERIGKPGLSTLAPEILVDQTSGTVIVPELGAEAGLWVMRPNADTEWIPLGHEANFRGGVISQDGRYVYLSALDHIAKIDLIHRAEVAWVGLDGVHQRIALSADGNTLYLTQPVTGEGGALSALSAETLAPIAKIAVANASPFALAVVPE